MKLFHLIPQIALGSLDEGKDIIGEKGFLFVPQGIGTGNPASG